MKTKYILALIILFSFAMTGTAQTYEEFLKQRQDDFQKFKKEQEEAMAKLRKEYADYVSKRDKEYSDYLKQEWEKFQVFAGKKPPAKPKPKVIPAYKPKPLPKQDITRIAALPPRTDAPPAELKLAKIPLIVKPETPEPYEESTSFSFFREKVTITFDPEIRSLAVNLEGKAAIAQFWDKASSTDYNQLINQLQTFRQKFNVNDFGYYRMVENLADGIFLMPEQNKARQLFTWFIMVRSGYDVRVAYNDKQIALLLPSFNTVYGKRYLTIGNMRYYIFSPFEGNEIMTYEKCYDAANAPIDFNINSAMKFSSSPVKKTIAFKFKDKSYTFQVLSDPGVIEFYKNYPQVDPEVYFNAAVAQSVKQSLDDALVPVVSGMSQEDAVNFLLAMVQNGFAYKTDPEQFGYEKFFFAEELFHYPAADCEDRSVLFAYLVRNLLSLKMVGLESPDHMFTAVHFTTDAFGDYLTYQGDSYIVADPTYINAPYGRTMPSISLMDARIIVINNKDHDAITIASASEIAEKAGIRKAGNLQNVVLDKSGDFFVTGYYNGNIKIGTFTSKGFLDAQAYIVARMDDKGKLLWADHIPCSDNATGLALNQDQEGNLFVAGSFTGKMEEFHSGSSGDLFMTRYTPTGERIWFQRGRIDSVQGAAGLIYSVGFSKKGHREFLRVVEYTAGYNGYGLFTSDKEVVFNGLFQNTMVPASATLALNTVAEFNYPDLLKKEYDQFVSKQTDRAVAGLLAISNLIRNNGMAISGKDVQKAFDKYNPTFRKKCPNMYKLIGRVSFIKNSNNIITIMTENGGDVLFDKLKLTNNSQMRVSILPDGNAQVDAINGIKVGKLVVWYPLNFVKIYSKTGDLLFDYDKDHSQAKMNMRKDILN